MYINVAIAKLCLGFSLSYYYDFIIINILLFI